LSETSLSIGEVTTESLGLVVQIVECSSVARVGLSRERLPHGKLRRPTERVIISDQCPPDVLLLRESIGYVPIGLQTFPAPSEITGRTGARLGDADGREAFSDLALGQGEIVPLLDERLGHLFKPMQVRLALSLSLK